MMVEFPSKFGILESAPKWIIEQGIPISWSKVGKKTTHKTNQQTAPRLGTLYSYSSLQSSLISISDSDSEVSKFIKYMHKGRLPSNLEPETPPPSYEGRKQLAKAICNVHFFAISNSDNAYDISVFQGGMSH